MSLEMAANIPIEGLAPGIASINILPGYKGWDLCPSSEDFLSNAIDDGGFILVNDLFLVKMNGKLTGLALETKEVRSGLFGKTTTIVEADTFYSPVDDTVRKAIRDAFEHGHTRVFIEGVSNWATMRRTYPHPFSLLEKARDAIQHLPEQNDKLTTEEKRKNYRFVHQETEHGEAAEDEFNRYSYDGDSDPNPRIWDEDGDPYDTEIESDDYEEHGADDDEENFWDDDDDDY